MSHFGEKDIEEVAQHKHNDTYKYYHSPSSSILFPATLVLDAMSTLALALIFATIAVDFLPLAYDAVGALAEAAAHLVMRAVHSPHAVGVRLTGLDTLSEKIAAGRAHGLVTASAAALIVVVAGVSCKLEAVQAHRRVLTGASHAAERARAAVLILKAKKVLKCKSHRQKHRIHFYHIIEILY